VYILNSCFKLKVLRLYTITKGLAESNPSLFNLFYVLKFDAYRVVLKKRSEYCALRTAILLMAKRAENITKPFCRYRKGN